MAATSTRIDGKTRRLVETIVEHVKSQGIFDQFRRECLEDLDQQEPYRQLKQRVESHVATFLSKQTWTESLPKNTVRNSLRCNINQSEILQRGVERLIKQTIDQKSKSLQTRVEGVVQNYLYESNREKRERYRKPNKLSESKKETKPSACEAMSSKMDVSQLLTTVPIGHPSTPTAPKSETVEVHHTVPTTTPLRQESHGSAIFTTSSSLQTVAVSVASLSKLDRHPVMSDGQSSFNDRVTSPYCLTDSLKVEVRANSLKTEVMANSLKAEVTADSLKAEVRAENRNKCFISETQPSNSNQRRASPVLGKKSQQTNKEAKAKKIVPSSSETIVSSSKGQQTPSESTKEHSTSNLRDEKTVNKGFSSVLVDGSSQVKAEKQQTEESAVEKVKTGGFQPKNDNEKLNSTVCEPDCRSSVDDKINEAGRDTDELNSTNPVESLDTVEGDNETASKLSPQSSDSDMESLSDSKQDAVCVDDSLDESDISEISSVHTSDLSSFDEDVSSLSSRESENEGEGDGDETQGRDTTENDGDGDPGREQEARKTKPLYPPQVNLSADEKPASALRRSRRISSRRSTKEDENDDQLYQQGKESHFQTTEKKEAVLERRALAQSRRHIKRDSSSTSCDRVCDTNAPKKRHRGRPRKDEQQRREKSTFKRESRQAVREGSENVARPEGASGELHVRHRSKRTVKRTRCYSPSSEGTREISLPSKRTRISRDSRD